MISESELNVPVATDIPTKQHFEKVWRNLLIRFIKVWDQYRRQTNWVYKEESYGQLEGLEYALRLISKAGGFHAPISYSAAVNVAAKKFGNLKEVARIDPENLWLLDDSIGPV